jgi:hypothetical protein
MASSKSLAKKRHSDQWWSDHAPSHILRCTGLTRKNGKQCNMEALAGLNVCGDHGGKTPAAIAAAFTRLGGSVEQAAETVAEIMGDTDAAPRDRLAAAAHVMKLLGMEKERHEVTVSNDPVETLFRNLLRDPANFAAPMPHEPSPETLALNRTADPQALLDEEWDVVDAEVVEEPKPDAHTIDIGPEPKMPKHIKRDLKRLGFL